MGYICLSTAADVVLNAGLNLWGSVGTVRWQTGCAATGRMDSRKISPLINA